MFSAKHAQAGFTTIEIIFLLVVIGVLSGIILSTHSTIAQKLGNTERQRDINLLRVALETYYSRHSQYPTFAELNNALWRAANMADLPQEALRDPASHSYALAPKPTAKHYAYAVSSAHGRVCDDSKIMCTQYTLTATLAGGGTYIKYNLD